MYGNQPAGVVQLRSLGWIVFIILSSVQIDVQSPAKGAGRPVEVGQRETTPSAQPALRRLSRGQVLYLRHCADCHGWEGSGDGPLAAILTTKPPALRQQLGVFAHNSNAQIVSLSLIHI